MMLHDPINMFSLSGVSPEFLEEINAAARELQVQIPSSVAFATNDGNWRCEPVGATGHR
jgi:hypothetical protein